MLDIIENTFDFNKLSYEELVQNAKEIGCEVKEKCATINNEEELKDFLNEAKKVDFEWFVLEWTQMMTKTKSLHYLFYKEIRWDIYRIVSYCNKKKIPQTFEEFVKFDEAFFKNHLNLLHYKEIEEMRKNNINIFQPIPNIIEEVRNKWIIFDETPKIKYDEE